MNLQTILSRFLDSNGRLTAFPVKRKMKQYSLLFFAQGFSAGQTYSEPEVNDIINERSTFNDAATIRRELCSYGFLYRTNDCTVYSCCETQPTAAELGLEEDNQ